MGIGFLITLLGIFEKLLFSFAFSRSHLEGETKLIELGKVFKRFMFLPK
jgi:hypothetical protein